MRTKRGSSLTVRDIATWCDCSPGYIHRLEKSALAKVQAALSAPAVNKVTVRR